MTIPDEALQKSAANQLIESVTRAANGDIVIVFKDAATSQGWLDLEFTIEQIESATPWTDEWRVNDVTSPIDVVIVPSGQTPAVVQTNAGKSTSWTDLSRFVSVDSDGLVQIDEAGLSAVTFTYTITADSKEAREVVITDTMSNLVLVEGSLVGKKTGWNSYGLEPVETVNLPGLPVLSGSTFTHTFAAEALSKYTFTYQARFDSTALTEVKKDLQAGYDWLLQQGNGGQFSVPLANEATIGGVPRSASHYLSGSVAAPKRPDLGRAFGKSASLADPTVVEFAEDGVTLARVAL